MTVSEIVKKMIAYSEGNHHDIAHFMKVYAYAKTIGECEGLDADTQTALEVAAVVHDIACPLCREKYGNTDGPNQEKEGAVLAADFLKDTGFSQAFIERIAYLVGHHHTLNQIDGPDYQILIEADYLVNADEGGYGPENIKNMYDTVFRTETGKPFIKKTKIYVDMQYYMPYSIFRNNIIRHIILYKEIIFGNGIVTEDAGFPVWRYPYEICEREERSILHGF